MEDIFLTLFNPLNAENVRKRNHKCFKMETDKGWQGARLEMVTFALDPSTLKG